MTPSRTGDRVFMANINFDLRSGAQTKWGAQNEEAIK